MGVIKNINQQVLDNTYFRHVLESAEHTQIVIMSIPAGSDIGMETHPDNDQVLYFIQGQGKASLNGEESDISAGDIVLVKAGTEHNFTNTGSEELKIITTYSPPHHPEGTVHQTKEEAAKATY
ncbi:cupin domain-containing protein [Candidatus Daviesbacteria bacterium]|nr:cupin domain-containing protein [Candidatus Daviesbacteria bacterium]